MSYTSGIYLLVGLPVLVLICAIVPQMLRRLAILGFSYLFFFTFSKYLIVYIFATTLWTYIIGRGLGYLTNRRKVLTKDLPREERKKITNHMKRQSRAVMIVGIGALLLVLLYLKYFNFFGEIINAIASREMISAVSLMAPIGISFYTLQAISYMVDVYWEKTEAEKSLLKIAMFLCFFPQVMEGPIALYSDTAQQIYEAKKPTMDSVIDGTIRILWGLFKKLLVADRLNVVVAALFDHYQDYSGIMMLFAGIAYTAQLYCEFSGCMDIVIGSARTLNVTLPENFRQPFASRDASEFWRRWHITLGVWFRTYIFYPVSVSGISKKWNKFGRKHLNKYITKLGITAMALFPVWFCNGLWHGPHFTYLFYGMYYFLVILSSIALEPVTKNITSRLENGADTRWWVYLMRFKTWVIIIFGEMIFRADTLSQGFGMIGRVFTSFSFSQLFDGTIMRLGLDGYDWIIILASLVVVTIVGHMKEKGTELIPLIRGQKMPARWAIYYALFFAVVILGAYGNTYQVVDLIYAGF